MENGIAENASQEVIPTDENVWTFFLVFLVIYFIIRLKELLKKNIF